MVFMYGTSMDTILCKIPCRRSNKCGTQEDASTLRVISGRYHCVQLPKAPIILASGTGADSGDILGTGDSPVCHVVRWVRQGTRPSGDFSVTRRVRSGPLSAWGDRVPGKAVW